MMRVLLAVDGSEPSSLGSALVAAMAWPTGTSVTVVTALPDAYDLFGGPWPVAAMVQDPGLQRRLEREVRDELERTADGLVRAGLRAGSRLLHGRAPSAIIADTARHPADLIVVGARGHGRLSRLLLGSVSSEIVDGAPCAILIARRATARRVLVATDGSPSALATADLVGRDGFLRDAEVRVMSVVDVPIPWWTGVSADPAWIGSAYVEARAKARDQVEVWATEVATRIEARGLTASTVTRDGDAAAEILAEAVAWGADLVVIGSRRQGTVAAGLLGSVSRNVVEQAPMSVLVAGRHAGIGAPTEGP